MVSNDPKMQAPLPTPEESRQVGLDDLQRPERIQPGSELQARLAAAAAIQSKHHAEVRNTERAASVERIQQQVAQDVEEVQIDLVQAQQNRVAAEVLASTTRGEEIPSRGSVDGAGSAPAEVGKIGTSLPEVREQVLDRLARVREQIYILSATDTAGAQVEAPAAIQGRGDFRGNAERRHDAIPVVVVTRADRTENSPILPNPPSESRIVNAEKVTSLAATTGHATAVNDTSLSRPVTVGTHRSLDIIAQLVATCTEIRLLQRIQEGVDLLCYTLLGVAAVGAIAADRTTRFTYRSLRELLAEMRAHLGSPTNYQGDQHLVEQSARQLAHTLTELSEAVDSVSAAAVADLCGVIVCGEKSEPLRGIIVNGARLGQAVTDDQGVFIFKNIPLHTQYEITPMHSKYVFTPERIVGTCFELNFERFSAQRVGGSSNYS